MTESYREVNVAIVREACDRYLQARKDRIAKEREELIHKALQPRRLGFFFFPAKTREQVIEEFEEDTWSEYSLAAIRGGLNADKVKELLALCRAPGGGSVRLSAEDAAILADYF
jgi:hypothetical protein